MTVMLMTPQSRCHVWSPHGKGEELDRRLGEEMIMLWLALASPFIRRSSSASMHSHSNWCLAFVVTGLDAMEPQMGDLSIQRSWPSAGYAWPHSWTRCRVFRSGAGG